VAPLPVSVDAFQLTITEVGETGAALTPVGTLGGVTSVTGGGGGGAGGSASELVHAASNSPAACITRTIASRFETLTK